MTTDTTTRSTRTKVCVLAGIAALLSFTYAAATPTTVSTTLEKDGVVTSDGTSLRGFAIVFIALQILAAVAALTGLILVRKNRDQPAKRALAVAVFAGLVPAVLPGLLAFVARYLLGKAATTR